MASLNGGPLAGFRNKLINGDFRFWQRDTSGSVKEYGADRWYTASNDVQMNNDNARPFGLSKSIRLRNINSSTTPLNLRQAIELPFDGSPSVFVPGTVWTASIYLTSNAITPQFSLSFTQGVTGTTNGGVNPTSVGDMTLVETVSGQLGGGAAQTWYRYARTFTVDASAAPDAADLCALAAFSITDTSIKDYRIAGAQLEPGPVASPYEQRPIATELALCQRYFCSIQLKTTASTINHIVYSTSASTQATPFVVQYPVTMRAAPTRDLSNLAVRSSGGSGGTPTTRTAVSSELGTTGTALGASGLPTSTVGILDFAGSFTADAEL
jgi:hypothetical protein